MIIHKMKKNLKKKIKKIIRLHKKLNKKLVNCYQLFKLRISYKVIMYQRTRIVNSLNSLKINLKSKRKLIKKKQQVLLFQLNSFIMILLMKLNQLILAINKTFQMFKH